MLYGLFIVSLVVLSLINGANKPDRSDPAP